MSRNKGRVAILGGGMAGLSTAWRLSTPGWRERFESITVYQRGWRLGGKAASSRGAHGRIEEHGLHVWLGSYENAFRLLRECYAELDRPRTDPAAPVRTWDQALIPADNLGLAERWGAGWLTWQGTFTRNAEQPGEPGSTGREMTAVGFLQRALGLVIDFAESIRDPLADGLILSSSPNPPAGTDSAEAVARAALAALLALTEAPPAGTAATELLGTVLDAIRGALDYEDRPDHKRSWLLMSMLTATARGILADKLITDPRGFRAINDEDFGVWLLRHGGHRDVLEFPLIRGLYDFVFGYEDADPRRPAFGAGLAVFLTGLVLFEYKGAVFWKMTAGMGDIVIAPIYQVLRQRGVTFEFFHRLDGLHLDARHQAIDAITMGRQVRLADGIDHYEPLTTVRGLPVFPAQPLIDQVSLSDRARIRDWRSLETHWRREEDAESRVLRRGADFDHVVLAVSLGMIDIVAKELVADRPSWRDMTTHVRTAATQAFQIWLGLDEPSLGWHGKPEATTSAYLPPFETWASMAQTLWAEEWPDDDPARTVAYFCGSLDAKWPTDEDPASYVRRYEEQVHADAVRFLNRDIGLWFPNAVSAAGFDWDLLCGADGRQGLAALGSQHVSVNIDPSDRYVQSVPGSDRYRLRPDESGYDNLVLAGDWTDCGMNAGCIEAAVRSGLQAANVLLGRGRHYGIRGYYLP
ncbi:MAG TPA: FAD-dependent oxidoreductase [Mycobacterium sp.]|nr:FAD-dependent oxidoreductase [Mycobacterium sp.]